MKQNSLTYLFSTLSTKFRDNLDKSMKEVGLHGGQVFILNLLWQTDGQSQAEMVKSANLTAPTVYSMVVRLAENGFVNILKDENDARIMRVFLTEKGRIIKTAVLDQWEKVEKRTFEILTETEKMMLALLLQKLIEFSK